MNKELQTEKKRSEKLSNENLLLQKTLETSISDLETKKQSESGKDVSKVFCKIKFSLESFSDRLFSVCNSLSIS